MKWFGNRPEGTFNPYSRDDRAHAIAVLGGAPITAATAAPEETDRPGSFTDAEPATASGFDTSAEEIK